MRRYAQRTSVPIEQSQGEIKKLIQKYGAGQYGVMEGPGVATIMFSARGRQVQLNLKLPLPTDKAYRANERAHAQECRRRWRALVLLVKAKLEAVEGDILTGGFEEAFFADIVVPVRDGAPARMHQLFMDPVAHAYKNGKPMPMLLALPTGQEKDDGKD